MSTTARANTSEARAPGFLRCRKFKWCYESEIMRTFPWYFSRFLKSLIVVLFLLALVPFAAQARPPIDNSHPAVQAVISVQEEVTTDWMRQPEILGTAVGVDD